MIGKVKTPGVSMEMEKSEQTAKRQATENIWKEM